MNKTDGVVVRVEGEFAWVRAAGAGNACGACARKEGCGTATMGTVLDKALGRPEELLCLPNTIHARVGDAVEVCSADGLVLRAVWRAYGLPLLLAFAGALLMLALTDSEAVALAGMLAGLGSGFLLIRHRGLDSVRGEPIFSLGFKHYS
jgi:positive regulator of sigma E activity